jgi:matrix metalloproteinase-14 (membrane-inserted)
MATKAFFFSDDEYVRYDLEKDKIDEGYPRPIQGNWPGMPFTRIDAAVMWNNGKAYFFSGDQYVSFDVAANKVDDGYPLPIQGHWPWPGMPFTRIDAAVMWNDGKAYFFRGDQYVSFDVAANKVDDGYPQPIKDKWQFFESPFEQRIDAAVMWKKGRALFFHGNEYVPWDLVRNGITQPPLSVDGLYWVRREGEPTPTIDAAVVWGSSEGGKLP